MRALVHFPVFAGPAVINGGHATFQLARGTATVQAPRRLLSELAARCDGDTPLDDIRRELSIGWRRSDVDRFLSMLVAKGALIDADRAALHSWRHVENPPRRPAPAAQLDSPRASKASGQLEQPPRFPLRELLERRSSAHAFSGEAVTLPSIRALLWACYGVQAGRVNGSRQAHRTVASGGALFPLSIHLVNLRPTAGLAEGIYAVDFALDGAVGLRLVAGAAEQAFRAFGEPGLLRNAQGLIVVSGRFDVTARKYGNRALLYVPLEAGHAAQNAMLAATDLGLACRQIGGFIDARLRALIRGDAALTPLSSIAFGTEGNATSAELPAIEFKWIDFDAGGGEPPFALGMAKFSDAIDETDAGWGRARDPLLAHDKTFAEAWERRGCATPGGVYLARGAELRDRQHPGQIVSYRPAQHARHGFPFRPYSDGRLHGWKDATDCETGNPVPVPAECVYYRDRLPAKLRRSSCTSANSSGVAAAHEREQALERAVLELVERDAFMAAWLERRKTAVIARGSLPRTLRARIAALESIGWRVVLKDLSRGFAPVVLAFGQHIGRGMTSVTAHAAFDPEAAADHALSELESMVYLWLAGARPARTTPNAVRAPLDHGALYAQRRYFRRADHLAVGSAKRPLAAVGEGLPRRWSGLRSLLLSRGHRLLCVDLTPEGARLPGDSRPLHVVRALVPGLLPITFGYGCEPLGLLSLPCFDEVLFPHPFA
ncbi:MAG: ribosomal protein methylthiotransferase accessory factor [Betaproteobacteria bacterium]|jgi:ribosomal protein S12 methylthiotransferase accessory factor|nr:ribosomal protein methylthiotransferase accessory factor [Betaproteobacteria bacterium]